MTAIGSSSVGINSGNIGSLVMMEIAFVSKDSFQLQITNILLQEISNRRPISKLSENQKKYSFNSFEYLLGDEISWDI
jgi:hypothetical protein